MTYKPKKCTRKHPVAIELWHLGQDENRFTKKEQKLLHEASQTIDWGNLEFLERLERDARHRQAMDVLKAERDALVFAIKNLAPSIKP